MLYQLSYRLTLKKAVEASKRFLSGKRFAGLFSGAGGGRGFPGTGCWRGGLFQWLEVGPGRGFQPVETFRAWVPVVGIFPASDYTNSIRVPFSGAVFGGRFFMRRFFLVMVVLLAGFAVRAVDQNGNQQSDVWEALFGAGALPAAVDSDGDGVSNRDESVAGTNPFDPLSFPAVGFVGGTNGGASASFGAWAGKIYFIEAAAEPGAAWVTITNIPGSNATLLAAVDLSGFTQRLFRVRIGDVFGDGSGISDWEKLLTGLSLTNGFSNGTFDQQGNPVSDHAYLTNKLAQQSVLSVVASDLSTVQPEPGMPASDPASFTIVRGGFPFRSITGTVTKTGTAIEGTDYTNLPTTLSFPEGVISQTIIVTPLANTNRKASGLCTLNLQAGSGYALGSQSNASVVIYPSITPKGTGLLGEYWDYTNSLSQYPGNVAPANVTTGVYAGLRIDPVVDFTWGPTNIPLGMTTSVTFSIRWTGQVQPQYSEAYYFRVDGNAGTRLWVDDQLIIDGWSGTGDRTALPMNLVGGVRYNIRLEYWEGQNSAYTRLYWYSESQPQQIIPALRLYPTNAVPPAPPSIVSVISAYAILGYPFTNNVTPNNGAGITSVGPLPPGLMFTATNKLISGVPTQAGKFQINISATNSAGSALSVLDLTVIDTGAVISREVWNGVAGVSVTNIPVDTAASSTGQLATLQGPTDYGDNYGERWRGYLTAPLSGNYYFWIAGSDSAELWISNDDEHINKVKRCWVAPSNNPAAPPALGTGSQVWTNQLSQKSPWLILESGKRYYIEVLHKAGTNAGDNVAVGWVKPDQTNALPTEVVPGQVLSPFIPTIAFASSGTLYTATMLAQGGVVSYGQGSATLRLSADETFATLKFSHTGTVSAVTGIHIHAESYLTNFNQQLFNVSGASPQVDGSYIWPIAGVGTLSAADVVEIVKQGKAYLDLHTTNYPLGELRGNFSLAVGASKFVPPPPPPAWADDSATTNGAVRFLNQASFGPHPDEIESVRTLGYEGWIDNQFALGMTPHLPNIFTNKNYDPNNVYLGSQVFNSWWQNALTAPDQLRQRVAFALSEILVISDVGTLNNNARAQGHYHDTLLTNAFGNFRELLEQVTLTPGMGLYLDMRNNAKGDIIAGTHPNENYAREILQLFSVGLYSLWPDGTLKMNSKGELVPTYDQREIIGFAAAFTGWNYWQPVQTNGRLPTATNPNSNYTNFMVQIPSRHDRIAKRLLDNVVLPAAVGNELTSTNVAYDTYALNALEATHDAIFRNETLAPYICRQLIQRLVTSHPSRDYVYRVVQKFNDNGSGVRGDLKAVIKAILLDREARDPAMLNVATFGKQREAVMRVANLGRAFPAPPSLTGTFAQTGTATIAVTFTNNHRFASGDRALFTFEGGIPELTRERYSVTVTASNRLNVTDPNILTASFVQSNGTSVVTFTDHYLLASNYCYLVFTNATLTSGIYQVHQAFNNDFRFPTPDTNVLRGTVLIPRFRSGWTVSNQGTSSNRIRFLTETHHELAPGDAVQIVYRAGTATDGVYVVDSVLDPKNFYALTGNQTNESESDCRIYRLSAPPLTRSGNVTMQYSTFRMDNTDTALTQTPLNPPTVFNFFFPDYKFSGALAAAGLTTPEFQLTSDSGVANINNFLAAGFLNNQSTNTAGLASFKDGGEAITLDLGPWCSTNWTSTNGIPGPNGLFEAFNTRLTAGQLSANVRTSIVAFVISPSNTTYSTPPTAAQIQTRVRATLHLIVTSPGYAIQK